MDRNPPQAVSPEVKRANAKREGDAWAEQVNSENAWDKLILTLDGGGIRGYSELLILEALMIKVQEYEKRINGREIGINEILPCHYFDYMWGTSAGGLIALMLGRLRMSIPHALQVYRSIGTEIFGRPRRNRFASKFHDGRLKEAIRRIVTDHCKLHDSCSGDDRLVWPDLEPDQVDEVDNCWNICQAVCITARSTDGNLYSQPLRSYEYIHKGFLFSPDPYQNAQESRKDAQDLDLAIWEAGRATSAAPYYFKMLVKEKNGKYVRYKDGGITANNPSELAYDEVQERHANPKLIDPAVLLSIGTGISKKMPFAKLEKQELEGAYRKNQAFFIGLLQRFKISVHELLAVFGHVFVNYTEGESVHRSMRGKMKNDHTWYRRLNVDKDIGEMNLGEWRAGRWRNPQGIIEEEHPGGTTLNTLEKATREYLERKVVHREHGIEWNLLPSEHLDHVAERLVRHRQKRRELATTDDEKKKWHTHQGRWASGRRIEEWGNRSCDGPLSRSSSLENASDD